MAGFLQTFHHVLHTSCALSSLSSALNLCRIFVVKSSGSSVHGGDGGGGWAEDEEAAVGIGGFVWIIASLDSDVVPMLTILGFFRCINWMVIGVSDVSSIQVLTKTRPFVF